MKDSNYFTTSAVATAPSDLNTLILSGFYRIADVVVNGPAGVDVRKGQCVVSCNGTTILQIVTGYSNGLIYYRQGDPPVIAGGGMFGPWRPMGNKAIRYVDDTGGHMYNETQGGLNTINVFRLSGRIDKYMPANPLPGDEVSILVANGRTDNAIYVDPVAGSLRPIMGLNETMVLDNIGVLVRTFVYIDPTYGWRLRA